MLMSENDKQTPAIIQGQVKTWEFDAGLTRKSNMSGRDIYKIFAERIGQAIEYEANRRYRKVERVRAAQVFPYQEEKQAILSILKAALEGKSAQELDDLLVRFPPGGGL
jgi:hypothetical protein